MTNAPIYGLTPNLAEYHSGSDYALHNPKVDTVRDFIFVA
jgi:hypothetical protein